MCSVKVLARMSVLLVLGSALLEAGPRVFGAAPKPAPTQPVTTKPAVEGKWETAYSTDFEKKVGREWSRDNTATTEKGKLKFLGPFGNDKVSLLLPDVPDHRYVRVTFEVFFIQSWDGHHTQSGPDIWELSVEKGPTLIRSTFANHSVQENRQSFPDFYPGGDHPALTGAAERNTLGYTYYFTSLAAQRDCDSVYRLSVLAPHTAGSLRLNLTGMGLEDMDNESWGVRGVTVEVTSSDLSANYDERRLSKLWADLGGEAMTAFAGLWELVAAGDKTVAFAREHLGRTGGNLDARIKQLLPELDHEKLSVRENASKELAKLGPQAAGALREALAGAKSEEVRGRIQEILDAMAKQGGLADPETARWLRAIRALEIIGSDKAKDLLKTLAEKGASARVKEAAAESLKFLQAGERPSPVKPGNAVQVQVEEVIIQEEVQDQS